MAIGACSAISARINFKPFKKLLIAAPDSLKQCDVPHKSSSEMKERHEESSSSEGSSLHYSCSGFMLHKQHTLTSDVPEIVHLKEIYK